MKNNNTKKIALAAVLTALCVVILFAGSVITVLDLSAAALASLVVIMAVIEIKGAYPWLVWLGTSALSLLLLPDKFGSLVFFAFAGYYPMIKQKLEKLSAILSWILKILIFNIALTAIIFASIKIIGLPETEIYFGIAVYLLCNAVFVVYDIALTRMISFYFFKLRNKFKIFR